MGERVRRDSSSFYLPKPTPPNNSARPIVTKPSGSKRHGLAEQMLFGNFQLQFAAPADLL